MSSIEEVIQSRGLSAGEGEKVKEIFDWLVGAKILSNKALQYVGSFLDEGASSIEDIVEAVNDSLISLDDMITVPLDRKKVKTAVEKYGGGDASGANTPPPTPGKPASTGAAGVQPPLPPGQNYVVLSGGLKEKSQTSSGDNHVIDGVFHSQFHTMEVKLKLSTKHASLEKELRFLVDLHVKAKKCNEPQVFIELADNQLFYGNRGQIQAAPSNTGEDLSPYVAIAMEKGLADLATHWRSHYRNGNFRHEATLEGADLLDILIHTHGHGYVFMDFKPANVVKVLSGTNFRLKAIDLDSAVRLDNPPVYLTEENAAGTPRYLSPEVSKFMYAKQQGTNPMPKIEITTAVDVFAMGLIAFEAMNHRDGMRSLWDVLGVNESEIISYAATTLSDEIINKALERTFQTDSAGASITSWLRDALRVNPRDRWTANALKNRHSLFGTIAATINMEKLATKDDIAKIIANTEKILFNQEENTALLMSSLESLHESIQESFESLGESLGELSAQAALGNRKSQEGIAALQRELLQQRLTGQVNTETLKTLMTRFEANEELTSKIAESIEGIASNSGGGEEVAKKMDIMMSMMDNMQTQITDIQRQVTKVRELTVKIDGKTNNFPRTFIIKPRTAAVANESGKKKVGHRLKKVGKFINNKIINRVDELLWDRSVLVFVCPVTMQEVPCGPDGKGYEICLPTSLFKAAIPALKWGFMFLKMALATQGMGAVVPDIGNLLPPIDNSYLDTLAHSIADQVTSQVSGKLHSAVDTLLNGDIDQILGTDNMEEVKAIEQVMKLVRDVETKQGINTTAANWEPKMTGLKKVAGPDGVMWVSPLGAEEFMQKGKDALARRQKKGKITTSTVPPSVKSKGSNEDDSEDRPKAKPAASTVTAKTAAATNKPSAVEEAYQLYCRVLNSRDRNALDELICKETTGSLDATALLYVLYNNNGMAGSIITDKMMSEVEDLQKKCTQHIIKKFTEAAQTADAPYYKWLYFLLVYPGNSEAEQQACVDALKAAASGPNALPVAQYFIAAMIMREKKKEILPNELDVVCNYLSTSGQKGFAPSLFKLGEHVELGMVSPKFLATVCKGQENAVKKENVAKVFLEYYRRAATIGYQSAILRLTSLLSENNLNKGVVQDMKESTFWCLKAAQQGDAWAQCTYGKRLINGNGVTMDRANAFNWIRKAVEQDYNDGMFSLGFCFEKGIGVNADAKKALMWYQKAAEAGSANAKKKVAELTKSNAPKKSAAAVVVPAVASPTTTATSAKLSPLQQLVADAEKGVATAQYRLGVMYDNGQEPYEEDEAKAFPWYLKAAQQNHPAAQNCVGMFYQHGKGDVKEDEAEAFKWFQKSAAAGDSSGQYNLAYCYENGVGTDENEVEAAKWYLKSAEQGDSDSQYSIGMCYYNGDGVEEDDEKAYEWLLKAAEQKHAKAMFKVGECLEKGIGIKKSAANAVKWYQKAVEEGSMNAAYNLAICYEQGRGGLKQDESKAFEYYMKAAEGGLANGQNCVGLRYERGDGVDRDVYEAVQWYRRAVEQGNEDAMYNLADCYENGTGVDKNLEEAFSLYLKAAEKGHDGAMSEVGWAYEHGTGIVQNLTKAVQWYTKASKKGETKAKRQLGIMYYLGNGVEEDNVKAFQLFQEASKDDDAYAQYYLGECYANGYGTENEAIDRDEAFKWYKKSAEQGNAKAQTSLALCYERGHGVTKNMKEAINWYRKSSEKGNANAQNNLGNLYKSGVNGTDGTVILPKDINKAIELYQKASKLGLNASKYSLGLCYQNGEGMTKNLTEAVRLYREAANGGYSMAQNKLGLCYLSGIGVPERDASQAFFWYNKAAKQNFAAACYNVGDCYENGLGTEVDMTQAVAFYKKAIDLYNRQDGNSLYRLAMCYQRGVGGLTKDMKISIDLLRESAGCNSGVACYQLGYHYEYGVSGVLEKDLNQAFQLYSKASKLGNAAGQYNLGSCYYFGYGTTKDRQKAFESYLQAANQNYADAMFDVGYAYKNGDGIEKDLVKAAQWYEKGAIAGSRRAQYSYGYCLDYGEGCEKNLEKAFEWYKKSAEAGYNTAQHEVGIWYGGYAHIKADLQEAFKWHLKSAENNYVPAQNKVGDCYENGKGITKDVDKAYYWYKKAAEGGNSTGMYNLGNCYKNGIGIAIDMNEAIKWIQKAADLNLNTAQYELGLQYAAGNGGLIKDLSEAFKWYLKSAENNYTSAQNKVGICYEKGTGIEKDGVKAVYWYRKAADAGNSGAQYNLADCYENGVGVEKDLTEAMKWYRKAADQNNASAQYQLGLGYESGLGGLPTDQDEAVKWFIKSAENNYTASQNKLGIWYEKGKGVPKDNQKAYYWYEKAAQGGSASGMYNFGDCFENGVGTEKDVTKAIFWYRKASEAGNKAATDALKRLNA